MLVVTTSMPQIFHPATNTISKVSIGLLILLVAFGFNLLNIINRSDYMTQVHVVRDQPVPFSHKHHVAGIGLDCRFCHTGVETSGFAGIPPTETCMTCHSQIWSDSPMLEPVRASLRTGKPLQWTRVHDLPDFAYFDHSIHVAKGMGCSTCHGQVDEMPLMWRHATLYMGWCLECHREPQKFIRPREEIFNMAWQPPEDQETSLGPALVASLDVHPRTSCSACHR